MAAIYVLLSLTSLLLCPQTTSLTVFTRSILKQSPQIITSPDGLQRIPSCVRERIGFQLYAGVTTGDAPVVKKIDKESNIAYMTVTISADDTQKAFAQACELFNVEVKERGYSVPGFRKGAKLPPAYLYQIFGEDKLKKFCGTLLSEAIQDECEKTGLMFVGRGRIMEFNEAEFNAGKPHTMAVECDLWPTIEYSGEGGYKGITVTVTKKTVDQAKLEKVKSSIKERYKLVEDTPVGYAAKMGDIVVGNMQGFFAEEDGSKGAPLPAVASGDQQEIELQKGKFMDGLIEGLVGCQINDVKEIMVTFPIRPKGPGSALSGKSAVFEVSVINVKTKALPAWDADLAARVRDGMTLTELNDQVEKAVDGDSENSAEGVRNEALAKALLDIISISQLPESLMEENTQARFQSMLQDFKEQGSTTEQLEEMMTEERYEKYKVVSKPNVEKVVKLGMAFRDIAEKEKLAADPKEIQENYDLMCAQARQKGETPPDEKRAKDETENVLLRKKVFDFIAASGTINWVDEAPPSE